MIGNKQPITTTLVGMNVAVFVVMVVTGVPPVEPTSAQLLKWGANWGPFSLGAEPWRMLASNYVHSGIIHIALNMWCLWSLGFLAERIFDPWTYVLTYTACGLAGSVVSLWWHPLAVGVGASGAIFGLAGALIAALYLGHLPISRQAIQGTLKSLLTFAGYNLFFGAVARGIDNSAHIGGLLAGLALGAALAKHLMEPPEIRNRWRRGVFIAAAVVLFLAFMEVKHVNGNLAPLRLPQSGDSGIADAHKDFLAALLHRTR
jgi:rhomboid protease GluP